MSNGKILTLPKIEEKITSQQITDEKLQIVLNCINIFATEITDSNKTYDETFEQINLAVSQLGNVNLFQINFDDYETLKHFDKHIVRMYYLSLFIQRWKFLDDQKPKSPIIMPIH